MFGSMSHGNVENPWFNASQLSWLVDEQGTVLVDKIIKLEELNHQWTGLVEELCVDPGEMALSHANPSSHAHYSAYYDAKTKAILDRHMAADIRTFGYTFEAQREPLGDT